MVTQTRLNTPNLGCHSNKKTQPENPYGEREGGEPKKLDTNFKPFEENYLKHGKHNREVKRTKKSKRTKTRKRKQLFPL